MKNPIKWVATHIMLALVVLSQIVFPAYSLKADFAGDVCGDGSTGVYLYLYDPVPAGHGDWTYSNCAINGAPTKAPNGAYFWAQTGTVGYVPWKNYIRILFSHSNMISGVVRSYHTVPVGPMQLISTYAFTNYSGGFGVEMYHFNDCNNGYRLEISLDGSGFVPYIERWANN